MIELDDFLKKYALKHQFVIQLGLVIRGIYVPLFWIENTEFTKTHYDYKCGLLDQCLKCRKANSQMKRLYIQGPHVLSLQKLFFAAPTLY